MKGASFLTIYQGFRHKTETIPVKLGSIVHPAALSPPRPDLISTSSLDIYRSSSQPRDLSDSSGGEVGGIGGSHLHGLSPQPHTWILPLSVYEMPYIDAVVNT